VLTTKTDWHADNVFVAHHIEEAIEKAKESDSKEIFIIGGGEIFKQTFDKVDRIYLTRVHTKLEGDTSYPQLNEAEWRLINSESFPADEKNNFSYTFEVWDKNKNV
jgi:dihydrofolate reductase